MQIKAEVKKASQTTPKAAAAKNKVKTNTVDRNTAKRIFNQSFLKNCWMDIYKYSNTRKLGATSQLCETNSLKIYANNVRAAFSTPKEPSVIEAVKI